MPIMQAFDNIVNLIFIQFLQYNVTYSHWELAYQGYFGWDNTSACEHW